MKTFWHHPARLKCVAVSVDNNWSQSGSNGKCDFLCNKNLLKMFTVDVSASLKEMCSYPELSVFVATVALSFPKS